MTRREDLSRAAAKVEEQIANGVPPDMDGYRLALLRCITVETADFLGNWRRCGERACRRAKGCQTQLDRCPLTPPSPELSPEEDAQFRAETYKAIKERCAELYSDD